MKTLFSLIESPFHPDFSALYQKLGMEAQRFDSARNLHRALQKQAPDFFVGEFLYGWGNYRRRERLEPGRHDPDAATLRASAIGVSSCTTLPETKQP